MNAGTAVVIGAAVGSGITGLFASFSIWLQHRAAERQQIRELAVKVALENFKIYKEASDQLGTSMSPIDVYLIHAEKLVSAIDGSVKTEIQIREHLRKSYAVSDAAGTEIEERNKQLQESRRKSI